MKGIEPLNNHKRLKFAALPICAHPHYKLVRVEGFEPSNNHKCLKLAALPNLRILAQILVGQFGVEPKTGSYATTTVLK